MRDLPSLHALLDVIEVMWTEHMTTEEWHKFNRHLYDRTPAVVGVDDPDPPGFSVEEQQASFAAFNAFAGGMG